MHVDFTFSVLGRVSRAGGKLQRLSAGAESDRNNHNYGNWDWAGGFGHRDPGLPKNSRKGLAYKYISGVLGCIRVDSQGCRTSWQAGIFYHEEEYPIALAATIEGCTVANGGNHCGCYHHIIDPLGPTGTGGFCLFYIFFIFFKKTIAI